ncbi:hypothetical protein ACUTJJ_01545 [Agrobacterium sp. DKPNP3]|uniref:hypothetical protein n=1 Tax=Agrobacterium sp. DKPNP3 TaxID=3457323 RepID=UPI004043CCD4
MSRDILPKSSVPLSTAARLKQGQSPTSKAHEPHAAAHLEEDPALIIGLVLTCARQGQGGQEIPSLLLARLHEMARSGDPTCKLVLSYIGRKAHDGPGTTSHYDAPTEIVSTDLALEEDR